MSQRLFPGLNSEAAAAYLEGIEEDRQLSAALAIHLTWLRHSSTVARGDYFSPETPLDMLLLYRVAAETFREWPPREEPVELPPDGAVINRAQAELQLTSIADERVRRLASHFARNAIALSVDAGVKQDLNYLVKLFLRCVADYSTDSIASGSVGKTAIKPINLDRISFDYW
jgi:hypothetical protein